MATYTYPSPPPCVDDNVIKPSAAFRREVQKVIAALLLFGLLYVLLLATVVSFAAGLCFVGFSVVTAVPNIWAVLFGLGLAGIGLMVVFFIVKFLFARKKEDNTNRIEITEPDYPDFFAFIRAVSQETHTAFPAHIYLSSEVNAFVFYNSGFWSMIFPVRKNLVVGLGLINMTNISEFKSVIAHEFGHFSQKSMRAGSYVYHANKVLYNMLYENTGYIALLQRWANIHRIFSLCAEITVKIVQGIQWLLRQAYQIVNRQYLSLSRQMEFHADAMSAKVAGGNNAIHSLRRIEFADACYNAVIEKYNQWLPEHFKGENLYRHQLITAKFIAADYDLPLSAQGLPLMHGADKHYRNYRRVKVGDQWASHPSREQREAALNALNITGDVVEESAWCLFPDETYLQQTFTQQLYQHVKFRQPEVLVADELFAAKYTDSTTSYAYPAGCEGYYDGRQITAFDVAATARLTRDITDISSFFKDNETLHPGLEAMKVDIDLLTQIIDKENGVRTFDFEGTRYKRRSAAGIKTGLVGEMEALQGLIARNDEAVFHYYQQLATPQAALQLAKHYSEYFQFQKIVTDNLNFCRNTSELMQQFNGALTLIRAKSLSDQVAEAAQLLMKRINRVRDEIAVIDSLTGYSLPVSLDVLGTTNWRFINAQHKVDSDRLDQLWSHLQEFAKWTYKTSYEVQKALLVEQLAVAG